MVSKPEYRWDFIGLSSQSKPLPQTSENVTDGSTFYEADTSKLYIFYKTQWYEKTATSGGGGYELPIASANTLGGVKIGEGLTIDAETGVLSSSGGGGGGIPTLTKDDYNYPTSGTKTAIDITTIKPGYYQVGSEDIVIRNGAYNHTIKAGAWIAVTGEVGTTNYSLTYGGYGAAYSAGYQKAPTESILLTSGDLYTSAGNHADGPMTQKATTEMVFRDPNARRTVAIGSGSNAEFFGTALGVDAKAMGRASVALAGSSTTEKGVFAVGLASGGSTLTTTDGYNSTSYRLITGVHDPQSAHDAVTKGYCDNAIINGGTTAPTTATVGTVGTQYTYVDTTGTPTAHLCVCIGIDTTDPSSPVYTWQTLV